MDEASGTGVVAMQQHTKNEEEARGLEELKKKFHDEMNEVFEMWLDGALTEEDVQGKAANAALDFMRYVEMEGTN